jgi:hypothetical protein
VPITQRNTGGSQRNTGENSQISKHTIVTRPSEELFSFTGIYKLLNECLLLKSKLPFFRTQRSQRSVKNAEIHLRGI